MLDESFKNQDVWGENGAKTQKKNSSKSIENKFS